MVHLPYILYCILPQVVSVAFYTISLFIGEFLLVLLLQLQCKVRDRLWLETLLLTCIHYTLIEFISGLMSRKKDCAEPSESFTHTSHVIVKLATSKKSKAKQAVNLGLFDGLLWYRPGINLLRRTAVSKHRLDPPLCSDRV